MKSTMLQQVMEAPRKSHSELFLYRSHSVVRY